MAAAVKAVRNKKRHEREAREEQLEHVPVIFERYDAGSGLAKEELIAALRDVGLVELGPGTDDAIASDLMQRYKLCVRSQPGAVLAHCGQLAERSQPRQPHPKAVLLPILSPPPNVEGA